MEIFILLFLNIPDRFEILYFLTEPSRKLCLNFMLKLNKINTIDKSYELFIMDLAQRRPKQQYGVS